MLRVGEGYDVHKFIEGRKLILGGEEITYEQGLLGHSDADVLTHAIMDCLLGACALGDIGKYFPDTDKKYKDADSIQLLKEVKNILLGNNDRKKIFEIVNIDSTIICEKPKLRNHIDNMRLNISKALDINIDKVNIKATTEEGLGFTGRKEGIAVKAICLVEEK